MHKFANLGLLAQQHQLWPLPNQPAGADPRKRQLRQIWDKVPFDKLVGLIHDYFVTYDTDSENVLDWTLTKVMLIEVSSHVGVAEILLEALLDTVVMDANTKVGFEEWSGFFCQCATFFGFFLCCFL
jgi:hypothetical protein